MIVVKEVLKVAIPALAVAVFSATGIADEGNDTNLLKSMTVEEQNEYRKRLDEAANDAERQRIENDYQLKNQQQTQLKEGHGKGQAQGGAIKAKGQGNPSQEGKAGPYGSKNKPQKGGS